MNSKENIIPTGVCFKFIVNPALTSNHQKGLKYLIRTQSELNNYFEPISVHFFDCYKGNNLNDDKLKGKQMLVKVFCPTPIVSVSKNGENKFYAWLEKEFTKWFINTVQKNKEKKYSAELEIFLHTLRLA